MLSIIKNHGFYITFIVFLNIGVFYDLASSKDILSRNYRNFLSRSISHSIVKGYEVTQVTPVVQHGEGPFWEPIAGVLYFVDTFQATAYRWDPKTNVITSHKLEDRNSIGTIMPVRGKPNEFIISADRYIYHFEWDGLKNNSGKVTQLLEIEEDKPKNQFNDGKADMHGNIWLGTLTREEDLSVSPYGGSLYKFIPSEGFAHEEIMSSVSISNGITWSKDNKYMFYIDSAEGTVEKWKFDKHSGTISNREVLFDLANYVEIEGIPDGMTSDSKNNLYVAIHGGSLILKIHPSTGEVLQSINIPAKYVTSAAFGGPNLDILYVTTSRLKENDTLTANPLAGAVFAVTGLGARGLPMYEPIA